MLGKKNMLAFVGRAGLIQVPAGIGQEMSPQGWVRIQGRARDMEFPRPLPPGARKDKFLVFTCFWKLPDNQSLSTHCWPSVVWLRNTFKLKSLHTAWPGQL